MKQKITAFILAALMLAGTFISCGESENNTPETSAEAQTPETAAGSTDAEETEETAAPTAAEIRAQTPDDLPALDFEGLNATIGARAKNWFEGEMYAEELNGEAVNDAVFERDLTVENRLNLTINYELLEDTIGDGPIELNVKADIDHYTLNAGYAFLTIGSGIQGNYYNLLGDYPEHLNLGQPWWSQHYNEQARIGNAAFFAVGDICFSLIKLSFVTFTNMQMVENLNIENPFDLVRSGAWTIDKQIELASKAYTDKNGNGQTDADDVYGMSIGGLIGLDPYWSAFNMSLITRDENKNPVVSFDVDKLSAAIEKLDSIYKKADFAYCPAVTGSDEEQDEIAAMLADDRMLFSALRVMHTEQLRDMDSAYALLPLPKWNEEQDKYYTFVHDNYSIVGIPVSVKNPSMASAVMEAMAAESYRHVTPAYYDIVLNGKYIRDPNSAEMLDLAMEGIKLDFGWIYSLNLSQVTQGVFRDILYNGNASAVASTLKAKEMVTAKSLERLIMLVEKAAKDR